MIHSHFFFVAPDRRSGHRHRGYDLQVRAAMDSTGYLASYGRIYICWKSPWYSWSHRCAASRTGDTALWLQLGALAMLMPQISLKSFNCRRWASSVHSSATCERIRWETVVHCIFHSHSISRSYSARVPQWAICDRHRVALVCHNDQWS